MDEMEKVILDYVIEEYLEEDEDEEGKGPFSGGGGQSPGSGKGSSGSSQKSSSDTPVLDNFGMTVVVICYVDKLGRKSRMPHGAMDISFYWRVSGF